MTDLLAVENLKLYYRTRRGPVKAVDDVVFTIQQGSCLAIVGESGCGKSSIAYAIVRILPTNVHTYTGSVKFNGTDLMQLSEEELRKNYRLRKVAMVFQGAMNALNPVISVGEQIAEPLVVHQDMKKKEALEQAAKMVERVKLPTMILDKYPHELSGGMKQRVVIAMALIMNPELLILDEPTSALDVITQANIINFLKDLKRELKLTYLFITHDLGLASELSDRFAVMYAGKMVEVGDAYAVLRSPKHPYTQKLLAATPRLREEANLEYIPGSPPDLVDRPTGCSFHPRCPYAMDVCRIHEPRPSTVGGGQYAACWLYGEARGND